MPDLPDLRSVASTGVFVLRSELMPQTVRDLLGDPQTWPDYRTGGMRMPLLRGATIVGAREVDPDEIRIIIDAHGQILHSTFFIADRDVRQSLLRILQPAAMLEECLDRPVEDTGL
jgi:hypothetical protein